jgi:hypothetical protein
VFFILVEIRLEELLGLVRIRSVFDVIAQMAHACRARVVEMD